MSAQSRLPAHILEGLKRISSTLPDGLVDEVLSASTEDLLEYLDAVMESLSDSAYSNKVDCHVLALLLALGPSPGVDLPATVRDLFLKRRDQLKDQDVLKSLEKVRDDISKVFQSSSVQRSKKHTPFKLLPEDP